MKSGLTSKTTSLVQRMATAQMLQTCVAERVVAPGYDPATLNATSGSRITIYTGICRLWIEENPSLMDLGQAEFLIYQINFSIPWSTPQANIPILHDEIQILTSPTDPQWVNQRYRIQAFREGGQIRATRSYTVQALETRT